MHKSEEKYVNLVLYNFWIFIKKNIDLFKFYSIIYQSKTFRAFI